MNKAIAHIGTLDGRLLLFGGAYSNLEALTTVQRIAWESDIPPGRVICTGDTVGYCAEPEACARLLRDWGVHSIAGNVEIQLRNGDMDCGCDFSVDSRCDLFAKQWYPYAARRVSAQTLAYFATLPEILSFDYEGKKCVVVHGSYFRTSEFIFASTPWTTKAENFKATNADVIIAGHCGLPFHEVKDEKYWLNPGVIGMPANDGTTRVWYMIIEPNPTGDDLCFQHHTFEFDYDETFARMLEEELPIAYAKTLSSGLWDNNDILPPTETAAQGRALRLDEKRVRA